MATGSEPLRRARRESTAKMIVFLTVIGVVICVGGGGLVGYLTIHSLTHVTDPPYQATTAFLDDLRGADYAGAYGRLCTATRVRFSQGEFVQLQQDQPKLASYRLTEISISSTSSPATSSIKGELTREDKRRSSHTFTLVYEEPNWRICGDPY